MEHVQLDHGYAVLAGFGLARADLFLRFPSDPDVSDGYLPGIDGDSGIRPVSSCASRYFFVYYVADPQRVQVAAHVDDRFLCVFSDDIFSNEAAWHDGAARGTTVGYCRCSLGPFF